MSMIGLEEQCFGGLLVQGGYDSIYRGLVGRLAECDFRESAQRLGLEYVDGQVLVRFLMRDYGITLKGVQPLDGQPVNVNNLSVVLYYLLSKGDGDPENSYIPFQSIPRLTGGLNAQTRMMNDPLERYFGEDYQKFRDAALKLGGIEEESGRGKHVWMLAVLPKIPMKIIFYEADEDFPVDIQIMLDNTAIQFLEFECLAFLVGCVVRALIKTAQRHSVTGWE